MAWEFKLPDIGEGVVEGELVKWLVEDGAAVEEDTPLFEVLTDKVSAVIPSPKKGTIAKRHFEEGDMVPVGAVVVSIDVAGGSAAAAEPEPAKVAESAAPSQPTTAQPTPTAAQPEQAESNPAESQPATSKPAASKPASSRPAAAKPAAHDAPVRAAPATRKLARTLGVDLHQVTGSGDHGRITQADVRAWAERVADTPTGGPSLASRADETVKLIGLRRRISDNMRASKDTHAHFTYVEEIDFTEIVAMKDALRAAGVKTTFLPFVMKAVAAVLRRPEYKLLNAWVDYDAGTIVAKGDIHLGIAAATDAGLVVPVIEHVDRKPMRQLVDELNATAEGAREGTLAAGRYSGSTFTITSLGKLGGMFATPVINGAETGILGLHKIEKRPVVVGDEIVIRQRMYMSCSFDHRIVDGHVGAAFVQDVRALLETPALLLAELA